MESPSPANITRRRPETSARPLNLAVVGCGGMGAAHVQAALRNPSFRLTAVCDVNPEAFEQIPDNIRRYASSEELFEKEELDVATLVLPNYLYEPNVQLAACHGVNILCEKPLGHNLASCHRIIELAKKNGIRGWISSQRKYMPHFLSAREKLATFSVDFANVIFTYYWSLAFSGMGWRGDRQKSGGIAVIDSGWHVFDALLWLMGNPSTVFAQLITSKKAPSIDEKAAIQLRYPTGALANLTISYTIPQNTFEFLFTDETRTLIINYESTRYFENGQLLETFEANPHFDVMDSMYSELATALGGETTSPYITSFAQGEWIMKVIDACYRSAQSGQTILLGNSLVPGLAASPTF